MRFALSHQAKCKSIPEVFVLSHDGARGTFDAQSNYMPQRKIHGHGRITKSPATPETVSGRARELSLIEGREPNRPTSADRIQAKKELLGDESAESSSDDPQIPAQRLDKRPDSTGKQVPNRLPDDDQTTEQLVQEGVDEAEHDEMVAASKTRTKSEG